MKTFGRIGLLTFAALVAGAFFLQAPAVGASEKEFRDEVEPLLAKYCYDCHGEGASKGDVELDAFADYSSLAKDKRFWKRVWENLHARTMPPARKLKPTDIHREAVMGWIERTVFQFDPSVPDPGRVTIRRLNRVEYDNVIRDLTGVDFNPAKDFPPDDTGHGFDTVGDALSLSPLLLEKYLASADAVLDRALGEAFPAGKIRRFSGAQMSGSGYVRDERVLTTTGEVEVKASLPYPGEYVFRASAWATRAGDELAKMRFRLNGRELKTFVVEQESPGGKLYEVKVKVEKTGNAAFQVGFLNDFYDPKNPNPKRRDRNLYLAWLEVEAPSSKPSAALLASRRKVLGERPAEAKDRVWAEAALRRFASRAYRRPVSQGETARLLSLYDLAAAEREPFLEAIRLPLKAALVSPRFLFRAEGQPNPDDPTAVHPLDEFALASRLSFFLWSSMPDDRLFSLAFRRQLRARLDREVRRMLLDEKALAFVQNFAGQWLQLRDLALVMPDKKRFGGFDDKLRRAMRAETETFFLHLLRENRPVTEFLAADYTFANAALARHYGLPGEFGPELRRVSAADFILEGANPRGGLLTHGSVLTITSNPTRTSPVKRGKWVLDNLLGSPAKEPPPDVPELEETSPGAQGKTLREQLASHSENPLCASCHVNMDALGFALENFDGVGRWRERDAGKPINSQGKLGTGETFSGAAELQNFIVRSRKEAFVRCLTEKLLVYALGRGLEYYDRPAVQAILNQARKDDYRFVEHLLSIVRSTPFQQRRGDSSAE